MRGGSRRSQETATVRGSTSLRWETNAREKRVTPVLAAPACIEPTTPALTNKASRCPTQAPPARLSNSTSADRNSRESVTPPHARFSNLAIGGLVTTIEKGGLFDVGHEQRRTPAHATGSRATLTALVASPPASSARGRRSERGSRRATNPSRTSSP